MIAYWDIRTIGLLAFCIVAETVLQLCFKAGMNRAAPAGGPAHGPLLQPLVWAAVMLWAVEVAAWIGVLQQAPLDVAYPLMTLTYATIPLASVLVLGERLRTAQWWGAGLIALGVICVGAAA